MPPALFPSWDQDIIPLDIPFHQRERERERERERKRGRERGREREREGEEVWIMKFRW